jgi:peptide/nickel transport system substrate-binding protein
MQLRLLRLRFRRRLRKGQRQVEDLSSQAEQNIEKLLFRRFDRLVNVRRFVTAWLLLMVILISAVVAQTVLLSGYFQTLRPVPGGIYNEGVVGTFTNASPLYATTDADTTVSRLIFSGLFTYDDQNKLVGDLAKDISADTFGSTYTVHLKPGLTWHDGKPVTSDDVVFTYQMIQNPDAQSPLQSSWQGVKVTASDPLTVVFELPGPLASFPYNLTNGIVPKHILGSVKPVDLRSSDFNTLQPVGSGPFSWEAIQVSDADPSESQQQIALNPFDKYQAGKPKLQGMVVHAYASEDQIVDAFKDGQLTGLEGLTSVPKELEDMSSMQVHSIPMTAATMVFFKTTSGVLADKEVRQALVEGADVPAIINGLGYTARAVREPFLIGQIGYNPATVQSSFNRSAAEAKLNADGWMVGKNGIRSKDGQPLKFTLSGTNTPEYRYVANTLKTQWKALGVDVRVQLERPADFETTLSSHGYEAILHGISIGADPDVFVYWDSSQSDIRSSNRLNLSEYKNTTADTALEAGRTRIDPALRALKYAPFLQAWQQDAPALGLYQPRLLYLTKGPVFGLSDNVINNSVGRFNNVVNWEIRQAKVTDN